MDIIGVPMGAIMRLCYQLLANYGLAIILFTLVTKVILFPVSLWVHANGIKMVRIQPALNRLKIKFFGDKDTIADETTKLYKQEKYSPFSGIVPIVIQLILLIGLIQVIYHPLSYVLRLPADVVSGMVQAASAVGTIDTASSSVELLVLGCVQNVASPDAFLAVNGMTPQILESVQQMNMNFLGFDLAGVPMTDGGILLLIPVLAGLASVILSLSQNKLNPLQAEQGKAGQNGTMLFSVGISLVLGFMIPAGVGFYWIWSNLFTIVQQLILNAVYKPAKHIDYAELEASKKELAKYQSVGKQGVKRTAEEIRREKQDYKRFFSILNKHLVIYSESNGFYKYFENIVRWLLDNTNITIHYVTSDPNDRIFKLAETESKIKPYYIAERKLITLFMKMEADVVLMTLSDLDNFQYKRSYMKDDIDYVYVFHYPLSTHMVLHTGALNHYDTILCVGDFQFDEIRKTEEVYGLPAKQLISCGYGQLETLYNDFRKMPRTARTAPKVLIAPSWQVDNILDSCLDDLLKELLGKGFDITVRPHPEYVKRYKDRMDAIVERYATYQGSDLHFELDFTSNTSIFDSDVTISDWSGTAYEFSFVTERPCVFIDTPPKINNPDYVKLGIEPLEFSLRDQIGIRVDPANMAGLSDRLKQLLADNSWKETIVGIREKYIANFGHSGEVGGKYLVESIQKHIQSRKSE